MPPYTSVVWRVCFLAWVIVFVQIWFSFHVVFLKFTRVKTRGTRSFIPTGEWLSTGCIKHNASHRWQGRQPPAGDALALTLRGHAGPDTIRGPPRGCPLKTSLRPAVLLWVAVGLSSLFHSSRRRCACLLMQVWRLLRGVQHGCCHTISYEHLFKFICINYQLFSKAY